MASQLKKFALGKSRVKIVIVSLVRKRNPIHNLLINCLVSQNCMIRAKFVVFIFMREESLVTLDPL